MTEVDKKSVACYLLDMQVLPTHSKYELEAWTKVPNMEQIWCLSFSTEDGAAKKYQGVLIDTRQHTVLGIVPVSRFDERSGIPTLGSINFTIPDYKAVLDPQTTKQIQKLKSENAKLLGMLQTKLNGDTYKLVEESQKLWEQIKTSALAEKLSDNHFSVFHKNDIDIEIQLQLETRKNNDLHALYARGFLHPTPSNENDFWDYMTDCDLINDSTENAFSEFSVALTKYVLQVGRCAEEIMPSDKISYSQIHKELAASQRAFAHKLCENHIYFEAIPPDSGAHYKWKPTE